GTAFGALRRLNLAGRDTIASFGQGPVGLSATMLAKTMGARVITVDVSPERLGLSESFGADVTIDPKATDPITAIKDLTHGEGTDLALDCSASPDARIAAAQHARLGYALCCRRRHKRHPRRQSRHDPQAAHHSRVLDI